MDPYLYPVFQEWGGGQTEGGQNNLHTYRTPLVETGLVPTALEP